MEKSLRTPDLLTARTSAVESDTKFQVPASPPASKSIRLRLQLQSSKIVCVPAPEPWF